MEEITLGELRSAVGGILLGDFADPNTVITKVVSDNRMAGPGSVFFAIVGEKTDGHKYVEAALAAGAAGCVISRAPQEYLPGKFYLLVEDTLQAAAQAAAFYRRKFDIPVVAVTGSVGKTTTKDMIAAVLSVKYHCVKTQKNFNNYIGVPRTVFTLDRDTAHYKDMMAIRFSELVYDGKWNTPLREAMSAFAASTQQTVTGTVRVKLYKGNVVPAGVTSPYSLYMEEIATFGDSKEGTMAIRTHPNLRLENDPARGVTTANGQALNSEGMKNADVWGKRADWIDYWGKIDQLYREYAAAGEKPQS